MNAHQFVFIAVLALPCVALVRQWWTGALDPEAKKREELS